jgi:hypothetical protein
MHAWTKMLRACTMSAGADAADQTKIMPMLTQTPALK